ncbi:hypothetical protein VL20_5319 [Microcystis panniformis FACHB-1757]|uniref:Uncharacterized protein n=1 Tax=Microcystis panniformis FACHB-1757 TaxID=1638788 RepID=A0A0K1S7Q9_9CHRO|nr:hypothetical protein VL20_5319 [Microcystis panniformis FACHB-1757]
MLGSDKGIYRDDLKINVRQQLKQEIKFDLMSEGGMGFSSLFFLLLSASLLT